MLHGVRVKSESCTVRLAVRQVKVLDKVAQGELSCSQLVRMMVGDFVHQPASDRQAFLVRQLFVGRSA
jgi:hypothetical protein